MIKERTFEAVLPQFPRCDLRAVEGRDHDRVHITFIIWTNVTLIDAVNTASLMI